MNENLEPIFSMLRRSEKSEPRADFVRNARIRVLNLVPRRPLTLFESFQRNILRFIAVSGAGLLVGSSAVVLAAQYSRPGGPLYQVKRVSENVAFTIAPTETLKTSVANTLIDRRFDEIHSILRTGSQKDVEQAREAYQNTVSHMEHTSGVNLSAIEKNVRSHDQEKQSEESTGDKGSRDDQRSDDAAGTGVNDKDKLQSAAPTGKVTQSSALPEITTSPQNVPSGDLPLRRESSEVKGIESHVNEDK